MSPVRPTARKPDHPQTTRIGYKMPAGGAMLRRHYSLVLMGVWLGTAAALLAPDLVLPDRLRVHFRGLGGSMAGALALVFAAYNLVRWWAAGTVTRARPRPNPLAPRRREEAPYQPNPELDFLRVPDAERTAEPPDGRTPPA